jgi:hypothetical protein
MEAVMKRYLLAVLLALTPLSFGLQTAFSQADTDSRGNAAPGEALPDELKDLDVKDYYIGCEAEPVGLIQTVTGHVVVLHLETNEAYFVAQGDPVFQQDALLTLEESRCRVKFVTEDVITMGEDTRLDIEELIDDHELQRKKSVISMAKGKALFYVVPLFRYKDISGSVKTQTAVVGVRGTKFGVEVRKVSEELAQGQPIYVADASDSSLLYLAATNPSETQTVVYGFEGDVEVYSPVDGTTQTVGEGENLQLTSMGAGDIEDTSPSTAQQFMSDTHAPAPGEAGAPTGAETGAPPPADTGEPVIDPDTGNLDITQDQTTENVPAPEVQRPTNHYGYFSGLITYYSFSEFQDAVVSTSREDFDGYTVYGYGINAPGDYVMGQGGSPVYDDPYIGLLKIDAYDSGNLGTSHPIAWDEIGFNAYQEWGRWTTEGNPITISEIPGDYTVCEESSSLDRHNRGYYIFGDYTPDSAVSGISGTYSGDAWGTYWSLSGANAEMTGTFSCKVNIVPGDITDFTLNVTDGVRSADISNGTGSFDSPTSHFSLSSATYTLTPGGGSSGALSGSLYGPNGEYIGGAGAIHNAANGTTGADLLFRGNKQ